MEHGHLFAEPPGQLAEQLRRQRDLRHEQHGGAPRRERPCNQLHIDGSLPAAGHAVKQRRAGLFPLRLRPESFHSCGLLLVQAHRFRLRRNTHCLPKDRLLRDRDQLQLFQPPQRRHRRARQLTDLLRRPAAHRAQQLQHRLLQRRSALFAPCEVHCVLRRDGQRRELLCLYAAAPCQVEARGQHFFGLQRLDRQRQLLLIGKPLPQRRVRRASAKFPQKLHELPGEAAVLRHICRLRRQRERLLPPKPQARRQNGLHRVIIRAEIPLAQKARQPQLLRRQHRLLVQRLLDGLELCFLARAHGQHHGFLFSVPVPKRNEHPHPRPQHQPVRNPVGIGPVDGIHAV